MKLPYLFAIALLGLAGALPARAQTPASGLPATAPSPAPGAPLANPVPVSATTPTSPETARPLYTNGMPPARNIDAGTQRADQPRTNSVRLPAVTGSQPTYRLHKGRPSTKNQPVD